MTLKQYRFADVTVFIILAVGISFISEYLYSIMPIKYYYFNLSLLVSLILMVRWGWIGAVAFALSGIPVMVYRGGEANLFFQVLFYSISNLSIGLSWFILKKIDKQQLAKSFRLTLYYLMTAFIGIIVVKGMFMMVVGENPWLSALQFFIGESFNFFITTVLFILISKLSDELIVDMTDYLFQLQGEKSHI